MITADTATVMNNIINIVNDSYIKYKKLAQIITVDH